MAILAIIQRCLRNFDPLNSAYNTFPARDQNADGSCTPIDFVAWIPNYNDGCWSRLGRYQ